jgi:hypothetical protein
LIAIVRVFRGSLVTLAIAAMPPLSLVQAQNSKDDAGVLDFVRTTTNLSAALAQIELHAKLTHFSKLPRNSRFTSR